MFVVSHAAWDVHAVPGVQAMHSVHGLGTARSHRAAGPSLTATADR